MITVYGIKNCDTVKKALAWLTERHIEHKLHDFRVNGLDKNWLHQAETCFGWETLVNKRSTTWRNLRDDIKQTLSKQTALELLLAQPTLIKRPIILQQNISLIGFNPKDYENTFKQS